MMKVRAEHILLFLAVFLLDLNFLLTNTCKIATQRKILIIFAAIALFCAILVGKKIEMDKYKYIYIILFLLNILQFSWSNMCLSFFLIFVLWLISGSVTNTKEICRIFLLVSIIGVILWIFMLQTGIIENLQYEIFYEEWRTRNTGGFANVNTFSTYIYAIAILLILNYEKNIFVWLAATTIMFATYEKSDTRTTMLVFILFIIGYWGIQLISRIRHGLKSLSIPIKVLICLPCIISLLSPVLLVRMPLLNRLLSGRLEANTEFIANFTLQIVVFGGGGNEHQIDNMYLMFIYNMGILFFILLLYITFKAIDQLIIEKDIKGVVFIVTCFYMGLMEAIFIKPGFGLSSMLWLIIFSAFQRYKNQKTKNKSSIVETRKQDKIKVSLSVMLFVFSSSI